MDDRYFREPVRENAEPPSSESGVGDVSGATEEREDHDLPAGSYINHASAIFNFNGGGKAEQKTRIAPASTASMPQESAARPEKKETEDRYAPGAPAQSGLPPTPPWMNSGQNGAESPSVPPPENTKEPFSPVLPDPSLMPDIPEDRKTDRQAKRLKWVIAGLCVIIALLTGLVVFILKSGDGDSGTVEPVSEQTKEFVLPQTVPEIAAFYQTAVNKVKKDGMAGYRRKSWQEISEFNLTGITFVDDIISGVFDEYVTPAENAVAETYTKGTEFAKARFPGFELPEESVIRQATCVPYGENYLVTIVFNDEDTPSEADSFLGKVTDTVFFWDTQIEPILADISQLKAYSDLHVRYRDMTITAEISEEGRFTSVRHSVAADVDIGSARVSIFTFKDKYLHFKSSAEYTDFVY